MAQAAKVESLSTSTREVPVIKPAAVTLDHAGNKVRTFVVEMTDDVTLQDIGDHPEMWKNVQAAHGKALAEDDEVKFRWFNRRAFAVVDWADSSGVGFCKPTVFEKRDRERIPYQDTAFEVRWTSGGWSYYRRHDGVRMSNSSWHSWEAARAALIREQYPAKLGA